MPVQGVMNRQGKSLGLMSKGRPPRVAVEGEAPGYPSSSQLGVVHPAAHQEAMPRRPSWSEPWLCQRNGSQGQGRCQGQFTRGRGRELRRDSKGCLEGGSLCMAVTKPPRCWQRSHPSLRGELHVPSPGSPMPRKPWEQVQGSLVSVWFQPLLGETMPLFCVLGLINSNTKSSCLACGPRTGGRPAGGRDRGMCPERRKQIKALQRGNANWLC